MKNPVIVYRHSVRRILPIVLPSRLENQHGLFLQEESAKFFEQSLLELSIRAETLLSIFDSNFQ